MTACGADYLQLKEAVAQAPHLGPEILTQRRVFRDTVADPAGVVRVHAR